MDADWDLQAVVRGCCSAVSSSYSPTTTATTTTSTPRPPDAYTHQNSIFNIENGMVDYFPDLCQPRTVNSIEHLLNNLYNPLHFSNLQKPPSSPQSFPVSPLSVLQDPPYHQDQYQKQFLGKQQSFVISRCTTTHAQGTSKFKKRKNQNKRVCQVPADGSSPDLWCWRKYGQKPIKGSPYPRGYYKCSTSKGCLARKQVERNRSDPGMLIITYTGEHSHPLPTQRNSLSGSSRNKTINSGDDHTGNKPTPSSPVSPAASLSPANEKVEEFDTDDDTVFDISAVAIDDDILDGLIDLVGPATGDIFSGEHVTPNASPHFPWLSNNVATTTTAADF